MITDEQTIDVRTYTVRGADRDDVPAVVALLADDLLGHQREARDANLAPYLAAFDRIATHPNQELIVVERHGATVGTLDLAILASLSRQGTLRMQIEAVRVAASERGTGLGGTLFRWVIDQPAGRAAGWSSSPPNAPARTPTASTTALGSSPRTSATSSTFGTEADTRVA